LLASPPISAAGRPKRSRGDVAPVRSLGCECDRDIVQEPVAFSWWRQPPST